MIRRGGVTLFPFLSVLLGTMGILAFLAVTFLMFAQRNISPAAAERPLDVRWVGAPEHVRPLLVECRGEEARFHLPLAKGGLTFTREALRKEVEIVRELQAAGLQQLGPAADRYQIWFIMKSLIQREPRLKGSLTRALHTVEMGNMRGAPGGRRQGYFPILLVYPDGIETYDLVSFLVETTTRFPLGLEPMLEGWSLPYRDLSS